MVKAADLKASTIEKPREEKLHAGICSGASGDRRFYRDHARDSMSKYLTIILIFLSFHSYSQNWVQVEGWVVPLKVNTLAIEEKLWKYIKAKSDKSFHPKESYIYQYKTINKSELYINAFCEIGEDRDIEKNFVMVLDGGSCYFQATYDFKTNEFVRLEVNGEA